jgi:restriction system protein
LGFWDFLYRSRGKDEDGPAGERRRSLESLRELPEDELEVRLRGAMRMAGYAVIENSTGGLAGSDWVLRRRGERTLLCLRHWRERTVRVKSVRGVFRTLADHSAAGCKLVTCGEFERAAHEFARGKPIELFDGGALLDSFSELLKPSVTRAPGPDLASAYVPSPEAGVREASPEVPAAPLCPRCRGAMLRRIAGVGAGAATGVEYWACGNFPRCPGTRPA